MKPEGRLLKSANEKDFSENREFLEYACKKFRRWQPYITEHFKVKHAERIPKNGPNMLLLNHDSRREMWDLTRAWLEHTDHFPIMAVARKGILDLKIRKRKIHFFDEWLMGNKLGPIMIRDFVRIEDDTPKDEVPQIQEENEKAILRLRQLVRNGINIIEAPTGATTGNGFFPPVKIGAFKLSHIINPDGSLDLLQCIPVITTYEWLATSKNIIGMTRSRFFLNFGQPYTYEPQHPIVDGKYHPEDIQSFANLFMQKWRELNTVTISQLAGLIIRQFIKRGYKKITRQDLTDLVSQIVTALQYTKDPHIDDGLLNGHREELITRLLKNLIRMRYIDKNGRINIERMNFEPDNPKKYKRAQPLGYAANRLEEVIRGHEDIQKAVNGVLPLV